MRGYAKLLALGVAGALLLTGCTPVQDGPVVPSQAPVATAQPAQTKTFALAYDPQQSFHPITGTSGVNLELGGLIYQGLYELDQSFQPQPVLAASATPGPDGLTWTVEVAQGVHFSDGTPLTAQQVADSLELARTSPRYQSRLAGVTGVEETGEYTLTLTLSAPNVHLCALLDIPIVLEQKGQNPLGTGAYALGEGMLVANPYTAQALPAQQIPLVEAGSPDRRMAAFDSGEVWMATTEYFSPNALGYSGTSEVFDYPTTQMLYLGFRTQGGPCQNENLRRAISGALNRQSLVDVELSSHGQATSWPISPVWGELPQVTVEEGSATKANLKLIVNEDNPIRLALAQQIVAQLAPLGLTVTVEELAWETYVAALTQGDFDMYLGQVQLTADFDLTPLLTGALAYGGVQNEVQALLSAWRTTGGEAELAAYLQGFAQVAPLAPICFLQGSLLVRWGLVTGVAPTQANPYAGASQWEIWSSVEEKNVAMQDK